MIVANHVLEEVGAVVLSRKIHLDVKIKMRRAVGTTKNFEEIAISED